jgi:hypothetical protein
MRNLALLITLAWLVVAMTGAGSATTFAPFALSVHGFPVAEGFTKVWIIAREEKPPIAYVERLIPDPKDELTFQSRKARLELTAEEQASFESSRRHQPPSLASTALNELPHFKVPPFDPSWRELTVLTSAKAPTQTWFRPNPDAAADETQVWASACMQLASVIAARAEGTEATIALAIPDYCPEEFRTLLPPQERPRLPGEPMRCVGTLHVSNLQTKSDAAYFRDEFYVVTEAGFAMEIRPSSDVDRATLIPLNGKQVDISGHWTPGRWRRFPVTELDRHGAHPSNMHTSPEQAGLVPEVIKEIAITAPRHDVQQSAQSPRPMVPQDRQQRPPLSSPSRHHRLPHSRDGGTPLHPLQRM